MFIPLCSNSQPNNLILFNRVSVSGVYRFCVSHHIMASLGVIVTQILLVSFFLVIPAPASGADDEAATAAEIEKEALGLPIDVFSFETTLKQKVDKGGKSTEYFPAATAFSTPEAIYKTGDDDSDKEVIVLKNSEDLIVHKKSKSVYVVLRRKQKDDYYVTAAFVRNVTSEMDTQSPMKIKVGDAEKIVEWILFDSHFFPSKEALMLKAYFCATTFITSCFINSAVLIPPEKFNRRTEPANAVKSNKMTSAFKFVTTDGSDADADADFFEDLSASAEKLNKLESAAGSAGGSWNNAFGVVCGVVEGVYGAPNCKGAGGGKTGAAAGAGEIATTAAPSKLKYMRSFFGKKRRKRAAADEGSVGASELLYYPGWKTQFVKPEKDVVLKHKKGIFYGFGNCPPQPIDPTILPTLTDGNEIAAFFMKVLRVDCLPDRVSLINQLVKDNAVTVGEDKVLRMNLANPKLYQKKIGLKEMLSLTSAAELHAFTDTYVEEMNNPTPTPIQSNFGQPISRSISMITRVVLKLIRESRTRARSHMVHVTRYMLLILRALGDKLQEDIANLKGLEQELELTRMDSLQIISLTEFIRHGLHAVDEGNDPTPVFADFMKKNEKSLKGAWIITVG